MNVVIGLLIMIALMIFVYITLSSNKMYERYDGEDIKNITLYEKVNTWINMWTLSTTPVTKQPEICFI